MKPLHIHYLTFLGDCAILLQAGMPVRRVLLFNLLSAFLAYWGTVVGTVVSQSSSQVTPWIFALTSGIFLYVALVDMVRGLFADFSSRCGIRLSPFVSKGSRMFYTLPFV